MLLQEHYDSAKANHLVAMGDVSSLRPEIGEEHPFSQLECDMSNTDYVAKYGNMTTFYARDRGETNTEFKSDLTFEAFFERAEGCGAEWYYIMQDGVWYVGNTYERDAKFYKKLVLLSEALYKDEPDSETQADLNETLGLDRGAPLEDLVARIEELDGETA
jgi:hypothetical protein